MVLWVRAWESVLLVGGVRVEEVDGVSNQTGFYQLRHTIMDTGPTRTALRGRIRTSDVEEGVHDVDTAICHVARADESTGVQLWNE